jgi:hypothetical protein
MQMQDFDDAAADESSGETDAKTTTTAAPAGNSGTVLANVPATVPAGGRLVNPFVHFRQRNAGGGFFHGPLIKCDHDSGEFFRARGETKTLIEPGERFTVNPHEMVDTWTKYVDGQRVERKVYRTVEGQFAPERDELGDNDEHKWPLDRNGRKRKDPWQRQVYLPMKGADDEVCAFSATGQGAIAEIGELVGMYGSADRRGKLPVIEIDARSFESQHGSTIYVPIFRLVDWDYWEPDTPAPSVRLSRCRSRRRRRPSPRQSRHTSRSAATWTTRFRFDGQQYGGPAQPGPSVNSELGERS